MPGTTARQRRDEQFELLARGLQTTAAHYYRSARNDRERLLVLQALDDVTRGLTLQLNRELELIGCPQGMRQCPDGSCTARGGCDRMR